MGIRLVYQPPAATIAGAAEKAGAGKKQYRDQDFAEKQKQFKASMDLNWEKIDLARDEFAFRQQYASDQQQAAVVAQDKALAANAQQAQAIDARARELAAMGIDADKAAAKAREEAATKRQEAVFTQAKGMDDQRFLDLMPQQIQKFDAMLAEAQKAGRVPTPEQQDRIDQLKRDYAMLGQMNDLTPAQKATAARSIMGELQGVSPVGNAPPSAENRWKDGHVPILGPDGKPTGQTAYDRSQWGIAMPPDPAKDPINVAKKMEQERQKAQQERQKAQRELDIDLADKDMEWKLKRGDLAIKAMGSQVPDGKGEGKLRDRTDDEVAAFVNEYAGNMAPSHAYQRAQDRAELTRLAQANGVSESQLRTWIIQAQQGDLAKRAILDKYGVPY